MKLLFSWLGVLCLAHTCLGQSFIKNYTTVPDTSILSLNTLAPAPDGGWFAAGVTRTAADFNAFVARFSPDGEVLWSREPADRRDPRKVVALPNGGALFFNNNYSFQEYFDASVLQISADGSFVSETIWGAPEDQDDWYGAAQWPNGEVVAVGISRLSASFSQRLLLAKWSATGQLLWEKTYDADQLSSLTELVLLPDGSFYAMGGAYTAGGSQCLLGKFAANGDLNWLKLYDYGPEGAFFSQGVQLANGNLFAVSYKNGVGNFTQQTLLINLDAQGNVLSQQSLTSVSDLGAVEAFLPHPDTVLIAAVTSGQIFPVIDNDQAIIRVSPGGTLLGSLVFGTEGQDFPLGAFFRDGEVVLAGTFDTTSFGTGQRAAVSRSGWYASCCEKNVLIEQGPVPTLPTVTNLSFSASPVPIRQTKVSALANYPIVSNAATCQSLAGTDLLGPDTTFCTGDTLQLGLQISTTNTIAWSTGASTPTIAVTQPGTYTVALSGECGQASDTIVVTSIGNRVEAQVSAGATICPGESVVLAASGGDTYLWSPPLGLSVVQNLNTVASPSVTTTYQVSVASGQCRDSATVTVEVLPAPTVTVAPATVQVPFGGSTPLSASGADSYIWSPTNGLSCFLCANPVASPESTLTYTVLGTGANGCIDTATVTVNVQAPCPFYVPNAFYPDNDSGNGNDQFGVFGGEPTDLLLRVYDRWGNLVFEGAQPGALWDGSFNGKPAPPGVYVYYLEITTCNGAQRARGDVTLVR